MSIWKDEADFMIDVENISEFYVNGEHNNSKSKFVFKSKNEKKPSFSPWYEDSDEDNEIVTVGRGRKPGENICNPGIEPDTHQLRKEIQMQVRSAVGNRYNNEVLESYYNIYRDEEENDGPSLAPKELSISYAKEQKYKRKCKTPTVLIDQSSPKNIEQTAEKLTNSDHQSVKNSHSFIPPAIPHNAQVVPEHYREHNPGIYQRGKSSCPVSQQPRKEFKPRGNGKKRINPRYNVNQGPGINCNKLPQNKNT